MLRSLTAGATMFAALASPTLVGTAPAAATPKPDKMMVIDVATANGSGCPLGTAAIAVSPDNTAFTVTYSEYTAQVGVGAKPLDFRKNCQLALDIKVPSGFTFAIARADYRGYAQLQPGASAIESANYYFQGHSQSTKIQHSFKGPFDGNWQKTDQVGLASLSFLPCGERRYLNVNTELRVNRGWSDTKKTTSFISMDSTDTSLNTVYHVAWKKC